MYTVQVNNVGEVCRTGNFIHAETWYDDYVEKSLNAEHSRVYGESVVLLKDREVIREHVGNLYANADSDRTDYSYLAGD